MQERSIQALDHIAAMVESLEKELTYNPQTVLGFALFPNQLFSLITLGASFGFGIAQELY